MAYKRVINSINHMILSYFLSLVITSECKADDQDVNDQLQLSSRLNYWMRERDEFNTTTQGADVKNNSKQAVSVQSVDLKTGYFLNTLRLDIGLFSSEPLSARQGSVHPNTMGLSKSKRLSEEDYTGDRAGWSYYKAASELKLYPFWIRFGYLQPQGQGLLAADWSFVPGTYRGVETGVKLSPPSGTLELSYLWTDQYKAPWYSKTDTFLHSDGQTRIKYLHTAGLKYQHDKSYSVETAFGQAEGYRDQFFFKLSLPANISTPSTWVTYQLYAARDTQRVDTDYTGLAWLQALTLGYRTGALSWQLEAKSVKAPGSLGYFTSRMTPAYGSSNGRMDIDWASRSDFNANGTRALHTGVTYTINQTGWDGAVGMAYTFAWNARPGELTDSNRHTSIKERAWRWNITYKLRYANGRYTQFDFRYVRYRNSARSSPQQEGYNGMPLSGNESTLVVSMPFNLL